MLRGCSASMSRYEHEKRTRAANRTDGRGAEFVIIGRHTGALATPGGAVLPTGKIVSLPMIGIFELRDGKLATTRGQFDRMTLAAQLGLLPDPAEAAR